MKSLLIAFACILTTLVIILSIVARGADTAQTKPIITIPVMPELFTSFAKSPSGGPVLRYHIEGIRRCKGHSEELFIPNPNLPRFRPPAGYLGTISIAGNSRHQIVGRLYQKDNKDWVDNLDHGFLHSGGMMIDLGALPAYQTSEAVAINNRGTIVGYSETDERHGDTFCHAVCWVHRKVRDLGIGCALSINAAGDIVGNSDPRPSYYYQETYSLPWTTESNNAAEDFYTDAADKSQALLWTCGYRYDLNDCIPPHSGWILINASGINNRGQIVGYGRFHDEGHAFLLTPTAH